MPADKNKQQHAAKHAAKQSSSFDYCSEKLEKVSPAPTDEAPPAVVKSRKRPRSPQYSDESDSEEIEVNPAPNDNEMTALFSSFSTGIQKNVSAKRKQMAGFTATTMKASNKRYDDLFSHQQGDREKIVTEYQKQVGNVFNQWDNDINNSKGTDEKLESIMKQLQKALQQEKVFQSQRVKSLKGLHEQHVKSMNELEKQHRDQQENTHGEVRKELKMLQKKMMDESQKEEMQNMRKSLQSMLGN